jgi:peptidoglycan L-alanyl-D-glutamate endopeptidase CwlK
MLSAISLQRLSQVHPTLASIIRQMDATEPAIHLQVTQGLRTWAEQDALYAQGRTTPGAIVTHARGGFSWHNFGLAVDLVPEDITPGQPDWNLNHQVWARLVSLAESLGLVSGAEWHGEDLDTPHVQITGKFPVTPDDEVRNIFLSGGITAVWNASGIQQPPMIVSDIELGT